MSEKQQAEFEITRLELRYCQRCGCLGAALASQLADVCSRCSASLKWIESGQKGRLS